MKKYYEIIVIYGSETLINQHLPAFWADQEGCKKRPLAEGVWHLKSVGKIWEKGMENDLGSQAASVGRSMLAV